MTKQEALAKVAEISKHVSRDNLNRYVKNHEPEVWNFIHSLTEKLDKFFNPEDRTSRISIFERLYCVEHGLLDRPMCCNCGQHYVVGFNKQKNEYRKWCSPRCQASDSSCVEKSKLTRQLKYGEETYNGHDKATKTRLERYGSYHKAGFADAVKATKLKNHGDANYINADKSKQTRAMRYGDPHYNNKSKNKLTRKTNRYKQLLSNRHVLPLFSLEEYIAGSKHTVYKWKCKECGNEFTSRINYNLKAEFNDDELVARCINCFPYKEIRVSHEENEVFDFIKQNVSCHVLKNNRDMLSGNELDIVIPDKKLAIEFDGLYWHSDAFKDASYHLAKTDNMASKSYMLVHVFEDEWRKKQEIVKARLKNILGVHDRTVFARRCVVKQVQSKESKQFQEENHLQGAVNAKVNLGLYCKDELVALMTFGKCRFDKKHEWEMLRFCCKCGCHIPGAAGKLLKHFETEYKPKSLVSYADRRWSQGKLYEALGFKLDHTSPPNYWYVGINYEQRLSRQMFQKHKLKDLLDKYDETKTEAENMRMNGYHRIFDCGNLVFVKQYS